MTNIIKACKCVFNISVILLVTTTVAYSLDKDAYKLSADNASLIDNNTYVAKGDVVLEANGVTVKADSVKYFLDNGTLNATGNVTLISGTKTISADEIVYNMDNNTGSASNVTGYLDPDYYICAKSFEQTSISTFNLKEARISACPGVIPDWSFYLYSGKLDLEGSAVANHITMDILNTPIIYSPRLSYPLASKRKTGLLMPELGISSTHGTFILAKFFIAPDINYDFTIGLNLFTLSGAQPSAEFRYALTEKSNFYASGEWIHDFTDETENDDRWSYILVNSYSPIDDITISLNANEASDYLYARSYSEFSMSNYFKNNKENFYHLEVAVNYFSNFINVNVEYNKNTQYRDQTIGYQKNYTELLPSISLYKTIPILPFLAVSYEISYERVTAQNKELRYDNSLLSNNTDQYNRFNTTVNLQTPIDLKLAIITPSVEVGYSLWHDYNKEFNKSLAIKDTLGGIDILNPHMAQRYYASFGLSTAFRELYREYKYFTHTIFNTVSLNYLPELSPNNQVISSSFDNLIPNGGITYKMINYFNAKTWNHTITLSQGFDFIDALKFTPLTVNMITNINDIFINIFDMEFSYSDSVNKGHSEILFLSNQLRFFVLKYLYVDTTYVHDNRVESFYNTSISVSGGFKIWRIGGSASATWQGDNNNGFSNLKSTSQGAGLTYNADCWSIGVEVVHDLYITSFGSGQNLRDEYTIYISFSLKGLVDSKLQFDTSTFAPIN